jgi:hypothetical protein
MFLMKANPGGVIDPQCVYGRDGLIAELWRQLEQTCVLMNAERRIGKTSILRKMSNEAPSGWLPMMLDLERFHSAEEFAVAVYEHVQKYLGRWKRVANMARKIYDEHEFEQLKRTSGPRPWKELLIAAVRDLCAEKQEVRLVFLWDEVPYMIDHIRRAEGEQAAIEVLDTLRSLRQELPDLRMLFSGSVGLHHVLGAIRDGKMSTEPVNDMYQVEVPPLAMADAIRLAADLIQGEGLPTSDVPASARVIAEEADCFPFYIHHVVAGLRKDGLSAEPEVVRELVARHLVDPNDPWDLGQYRKRIPAYYNEGKNAELVGLILDALAIAQEPIGVPQLQSTISNWSAEFQNRDELVRVLRLMERDH